MLEILIPTKTAPAFCRHPSKNKMRRIRANFLRRTRQSLHDSFGSLGLHSQYPPVHLYDIDSKWIHTRSIDFNPAEAICPLKEGITPCPHYFVLDVDEHRIPKVILKAKCKCTECLKLDNTLDEVSRTQSGCIPVQYYSRVLRVTGCHNGIYKYSEVWEPITVACTCAKKGHLPPRS